MSANGKKRDKGFIALLVMIIVCACLMIAAIATLGVGMSNGMGEKGDPGSRWHTGVSAPAADLGNVGDFYLDGNGNIYEKKADGWGSPVVSIKATTPHIGANGNWWVGDESDPNNDTKVSAMATKPLVPSIREGSDGKLHWFIGEEETEYLAESEFSVNADGKWVVNGKVTDYPATVLPHIDETTGNWFIGTEDTHVHASGAQGIPGADGKTPHVGANGNWWIGDETDPKNDTGVKASGTDVSISEDFTWVLDGVETGISVQGARGADGDTPFIGEDGHWHIGEEDYGPAYGADGKDGDSPFINEDGYWQIGDTVTDTLAHGKDGSDGTQWHSGEFVPVDHETSTSGETYVKNANVGDFYLNTVTGDVYCYGADGWEKIVTLKSTLTNVHNEWYVNGEPTGLFVSTWYSGEGNPDGNLHAYKDDLYLDTKTGDIYINVSDQNLDAKGKGADWELKLCIKGNMWYKGEGAPTVAGRNGDMYVDVTDGQIYNHDGNEWKPVDGLKIKGEKGDRGATWFHGAGAPDDLKLDPETAQKLKDEALVGDYYFDTNHGYVYYLTEKTEDGLTWERVSTLAGTRWHNGVGDPNMSTKLLDVANPGDVYCDTDSKELYQLEADKTWTRLGQLNTGDRGTKWFYGILDPKNKADETEFGELTDGCIDGDFYLQTYYPFSGYTGFRIYVLQVGEYTHWELLVDMRVALDPMPTEFSIPNYDALRSFRDRVNGNIDGQEAESFSGKTLTLTGNVVIPVENFEPVGIDEDHPFSGTFKGDGELVIENFTGTLFGVLENATIDNLVLHAKLYDGALRTFKVNEEDASVSLLAGTFGIAQKIKGDTKITNTTLILSDETATVTVTWDEEGEVSVNVEGAEPAAVGASLKGADDYALVLDDRYLELGNAAFTFKNIKFTGETYLDVGNAKSVTLEDCYADVDPDFACKRDELGGALDTDKNTRSGFIVSRVSSKSHAYAIDLTVKNSTIINECSYDEFGTAIFLWAPVGNVVLEGNMFGSTETRYGFTAVKFLDFAGNAKIDVKNNTVYGRADSFNFYAFDFCQGILDSGSEKAAEWGAQPYTAVFEGNTVDLPAESVSEPYGILYLEAGKNASAHAQIYFIGETNTVQVSQTLGGLVFSQTEKELYPYVGIERDNAEGKFDYDFIAFDAAVAEDGKLVAGNVYIGGRFGVGHDYTGENLQEIVDEAAWHTVWIVDIKLEDPLGFVQHVDDYSDTYYINNESGLTFFRDYVNGEGAYGAEESSEFSGKTVYLTKDLDFTDKTTEWVKPIGSKLNTYQFSGTFDGEYEETVHSVSGLPGSLFGFLYNATVQNLILKDSEKIGNSGIGTGALAAQVNGSDSSKIHIKNITLENLNVMPEKNRGVGGLIGDFECGGTVENITLHNVNVNFTMTNGVANAAVGGLIGSIGGLNGFVNTLTISNITAEGLTVSNDDNQGVGGLIGGIIGTESATLVVKNVKIEGESNSVKGNQYVGGLIGASLETTITLTDVSVSSALTICVEKTTYVREIGGLVGTVADGTLTVGGVSFTGTIDGGYADETTDSKLNYLVYNYGLVGSGTNQQANDAWASEAGYVLGAAQVNVDNSGAEKDISTIDVHVAATDLQLHAEWSENGTLKENAQNVLVTVSSVKGLESVSELVNGGITFEGETVELGENLAETLDMSGAQFNAIGRHDTNESKENPFSGTFLGNGKTIKGLSDSLFGYTDGAHIENITLTDLAIKSEGHDVGALIGEAKDTEVETVAVKGGSIEAVYGVGGVIGYALGSTSITHARVESIKLKIAPAADSEIDWAYARAIGSAVGHVQNDGLSLEDVYVGGDSVEAINAVVTLDNDYEDAENAPNWIVYNYGLVGQGTGTNASDGFKGDVEEGAGNFAVKTASVNLSVAKADLTITATWGINPKPGYVSIGVSTEKGLHSIATLVNGGISFAGEYVNLQRDVTMSASEPSTWKGIGDETHPFAGTFSGKNYVTENYKITGLAGALFGNLTGTVKDVTLVDNTVLSMAVFTNNANEAKIENVKIGALVQAEQDGVITPKDVAHYPYGFYGNEGDAEIVNSEISIRWTSLNLTFTVKLDAHGNATLVYEGDENTQPVEGQFVLGGSGKEGTTTSYEFIGLKFTGNSYIEIENADSFTMKNCVADVAPDDGIEGNREAFIRANSVGLGSIALDIEDNTISVQTEADSYAVAIFVLQNKIKDGAKIVGNTIGSETSRYGFAAVKLGEFEEGAVVTVKDNTVYGTSDSYWFVAFDFIQNVDPTTSYTVNIQNNTANVTGTAPKAGDGTNGTNYAFVQVEATDSSAGHGKIFVGADNKIVVNEVEREVKYQDVVNWVDTSKDGNVQNAYYIGYGVEWDGETVTKGDFVLGYDDYMAGATQLKGDQDKLAEALTELGEHIAGHEDAIRIVIGDEFGRTYNDLTDENEDNDSVYSIFSKGGYNTLVGLVNAGYSFEGKTVKFAYTDGENTVSLAELADENGNFKSIGTEKPFNGTFEGQNYTYTNLTVSGSVEYTGFFAQIKGATIKNMTLSGATVTITNEPTNDIVGLIAAKAEKSTIENITVSGKIDVTGTVRNVGAVVGDGTDVTLKTITVNVDAESKIVADYQNVGGVIGVAAGTTTLETVSSNLNVSAIYAVGGVVGLAAGNVTLTNVSSSATVTARHVTSLARSNALGGLVGAVDSKNAVTVTVTGDEVVAEAGHADAENMVNGYKSYFTGKLVREQPESTTYVIVPIFCHYGLVGGDVETGESKTATISNTLLHTVYLTTGNTNSFEQHTTWDSFKEADSEYRVNDVEGLKFFRDQVNAGNSYKGETVHLMADVDLGAETAADGFVANWIPIGWSYKDADGKEIMNAFEGTFTGLYEEDGVQKSHKVVGVQVSSNYMATSDLHREPYKDQLQNNLGFFGRAQGATIEHLELDNVKISGDAAVGGVVGKIMGSGSIKNVKVSTIEISAHHWVGGIAGYSYATIQNCEVDNINADVTPNEVFVTEDGADRARYDNGDKVGGIVGYHRSYGYDLIGNKVIGGQLSAYRDLGGLAGWAGGEGSGTLAVNGNTVEDVDLILNHTMLTKERPYVEEKALNVAELIGYVGKNTTVGENTVTNVTITYHGFDIVDTEEAVHVYTAEGLQQYLIDFNGDGGEDFSSKKVLLEEDVVLTTAEGLARASEQAANWSAIGSQENPFKGEFDGQSHSISGVTVVSETDYAGFFGYTENATVKNLTLIDVSVVGANSVGGLIGHAGGACTSLENVTVTNVTVKGDSAVGGLVGSVIPDGLFKNVKVEGTIKIEGSYKVGGILGDGYTKYENASVAGDGAETSYIKGVYSAADHEGDNVGGAIGYTGEGSYTYNALSVSGVTVSGTRKVGGAIGYLQNDVLIDGLSVENVVVSNTDTPVDYAHNRRSELFIGGAIGGYNAGTAEVKGVSVKNTTVNAVFTYESGAVGGQEASVLVGGSKVEGAALVVTEPVAESVTVNVLMENAQWNGTRLSSVDVSNAEQLLYVNEVLATFAPGQGSNDHHTMVNVKADIDMSGKEWVGKFPMWTHVKGEKEDGSNAVISNLNVTANENGKAGFFSYAGNCWVEKITLSNVTATGTQVGAFAGQAENLHLIDCALDGTCTITYEYGVNGYNEEHGGAGAIIGYTHSVFFDGSTFTISGNVTISYTGDYMTASGNQSENSYVGRVSGEETHFEAINCTGSVTDTLAAAE